MGAEGVRSLIATYPNRVCCTALWAGGAYTFPWRLGFADRIGLDRSRANTRRLRLTLPDRFSDGAASLY
jgi:hypothetical protein